MSLIKKKVTGVIFFPKKQIQDRLRAASNLYDRQFSENLNM